MDVSSCMRTQVVIARTTCDFNCLLQKISAPAPRVAYIVDDFYTLLGVVSARDLLKEVMPSYMNADLARSISDGKEFLLRQVAKARHKCAGDIMVKKVVVLRPYYQLLEADALFAEKGFNTLPVVDNSGKLLGEVTRFDILQYLLGGPFDSPEKAIVDLATL